MRKNNRKKYLIISITLLMTISTFGNVLAINNQTKENTTFLETNNSDMDIFQQFTPPWPKTTTSKTNDNCEASINAATGIGIAKAGPDPNNPTSAVVTVFCQENNEFHTWTKDSTNGRIELSSPSELDFEDGDPSYLDCSFYTITITVKEYNSNGVYNKKYTNDRKRGDEGRYSLDGIGVDVQLKKNYRYTIEVSVLAHAPESNFGRADPLKIKKITWFYENNNDETQPSVSITKPNDFIYVHNEKFMPFTHPLIIGSIYVHANAYDSDSGIEKVSFYVNNNLKTSDNSPDYMWSWSERDISDNVKLKAVAYDKAGNSKSHTVDQIYYLNPWGMPPHMTVSEAPIIGGTGVLKTIKVSSDISKTNVDSFVNSLDSEIHKINPNSPDTELYFTFEYNFGDGSEVEIKTEKYPTCTATHSYNNDKDKKIEVKATMTLKADFNGNGVIDSDEEFNLDSTVSNSNPKIKNTLVLNLINRFFERHQNLFPLIRCLLNIN